MDVLRSNLSLTGDKVGINDSWSLTAKGGERRFAGLFRPSHLISMSVSSEGLAPNMS